MKITAIWLVRVEDEIRVLVEIDGKKWHRAITESADNNFSHIRELWEDSAERLPIDATFDPEFDKNGQLVQA